MGMNGLLSGYNVVRAYSISTNSDQTETVNPPSWDLGIIVCAHNQNNVLVFPTIFAPNVNNFYIVVRNTKESGYGVQKIFNSVSASSIQIPGATIVSFILFSAR